MTVKHLKETLALFPDDMEVMCEAHDGRFFGPEWIEKRTDRCHLTILICELEERSCEV